MTDEQINERIAKLQGYDFDPECARGCWSRGRWVQAPNGELLFKHGIPNYAGDLNVMHEAEKRLTDIDDWMLYDKALAETTSGFTYHATARHRAEAFLRVLGLWED